MIAYDKLRTATGFAMLGSVLGGLLGGNVPSAIGACIALIFFALGDWE